MNSYIKRVVSGVLVIGMVFSMILPQEYVHAQSVLSLPAPSQVLPLSQPLSPAILKGVSVDLDNPFQLDFIIDQGEMMSSEALAKEELFKQESTKLIKYFLAALTTPEDEMWVNLSPYESDSVIPESLGQTEMGRDMLAQDYLLKQLTSSLLHPEGEAGKKFWDKIYAKAFEQYGTTDIPVETFHKVWIVPKNAKVYVHDNSAFVINSHLSVMLEEDYVATRRIRGHVSKGVDSPRRLPSEVALNAKANQSSTARHTNISTDIMRDIILPVIEKEVNSGETFAQLRQIYNSMILATWYKRNLKNSILNAVYSDQNKTVGVDHQQKGITDKIYNQYIEAFKTGVYNFIKEDHDPYTNKNISRKYFSGGLGKVRDLAMVSNSQNLSSVEVKSLNRKNAVRVSVDLNVIDQAMATQKEVDLYRFRSIFENHYKFGEPINMHILRHSEFNNGIKVLFIESPSGKFVLKRYPYQLKTQLKESKIKKFLDENFHYEVVEPIKNNDGEEYVLDGENTFLLFPWKGNTLHNSKETLLSKIRKAMQIISNYHQSINDAEIIQDSLSVGYQFPINNFSILNKQLVELVDKVNQSSKAYPTKARALFLSEEFQKNLQFQITQLMQDLPEEINQRLDKIAIHGDFHTKNILLDEHGEPQGLIDFDDLRMGSRLFDLAHSLPSFLGDFLDENQRTLSSADMLQVVIDVFKQYVYALDNEYGFSSLEIKAIRGYLRSILIYEILYRANLLAHQSNQDYFNMVEGDKRFFDQMKELQDQMTLLDDINFFNLEIELNKAVVAKQAIREVFARQQEKGLDPLLIPIDSIFMEIENNVFMEVGQGQLIEAYYSQLEIIVRKTIKEVGILELRSDLLFTQNHAEDAKTILKRAKNLLERVVVASGYKKNYLDRYAQLNQKYEKRIFEHPNMVPAERKNQIVVIPTQNRSDSLLELMNSIESELKMFHFGKYDHVHALTFIVLEDSTNESHRVKNKRNTDYFRQNLKKISSNYFVQYWSEERQEREVDQINQNVFSGEWDMREVLYEQIDGELNVKKGFSRIRNLGLIAARRVAQDFIKPNDTILTWIDDDSRLGTTVIHRDGTRSSRVHAFNYFEKIQDALSTETGVLLGATTNDSVNAIAQLKTMEDLVSVFEVAAQSDPDAPYYFNNVIPISALAQNRVWSERDNNYFYPMSGLSINTQRDYFLALFNELKGLVIGQFPLRKIVYSPQSSLISPDGSLVLTGSRRMAAGNNTSFRFDGIQMGSAYMPGIGRGEDLFKNILDAGQLRTGTVLINSKYNPIDHDRLMQYRIKMVDELHKHFLGISKVGFFARLIKKALISRTGGQFTQEQEVFLALDHQGLLTAEVLDEIVDLEKFVGFEDWKEEVEKNYQYIKSSITEAQRIASIIQEKGYLTDYDNANYFWLQDDRFNESVKILQSEFVEVFVQEEVVLDLERDYKELISSPQNLTYQQFIKELQRYLRNQKYVRQWWESGNVDVGMLSERTDFKYIKLHSSSIKSSIFVHQAMGVLPLEKKYNQSRIFGQLFYGMSGAFLSFPFAFLITQDSIALTIISLIMSVLSAKGYSHLFPKSDYAKVEESLRRLEIAQTIDEMLEVRGKFEEVIGDTESVLVQKVAKTGVEAANELIRREELKSLNLLPNIVPQFVEGTALRGEKYSSLFSIRSESDDFYALAVAYSYLKFGEPMFVQYFSDLLFETVSDIYGEQIKSSPQEWVVVNPAGTNIPNAAFLLAQRVSKKLGLTHVSLSAPVTKSKSLQNRLASVARNRDWNIQVNGSEELNDSFNFEGKRVIFIDDGVFTGTILSEGTQYLMKSGVASVNAFVVAQLYSEQDHNFEKMVDLKILKRFGVDPLADVLNNPHAIYTTRVVNYAFQLEDYIFDKLLENLTLGARINLYLYATEYFGNNISPKYDRLARSIERKMKVVVPKTVDIHAANDEQFFLEVVEMIKQYGMRVEVDDFQVIIGRLWSLLSYYKQEASIKLVLFDLDKTLNFSDRYYEAVRTASLEIIAEKTGLNVDVIEKQITELRNQLRNSGSKMRQYNIASEFGINYSEFDKLMADRIDVSKYIVASSDIFNMLTSLKAQAFSLGVLTDSGPLQARAVLSALGILNTFGHIISAPEIDMAKPDQGVYQYALAMFGVKPYEAIMIGDSVDMDINPAKRLGMNTVHVKTPEDVMRVGAIVGELNTAHDSVQHVMPAQDLGGIDFNPDNLNLETLVKDSQNIQFKFTPEQIEEMRNNVTGLMPVIISIQPITNLPLLLGFNPDKESEESRVLLGKLD